MNRQILDTAVDPETKWLWVCYGGSADTGWHWATVAGNSQGAYYSHEYKEGVGHSSLQRAIKDGITRVTGQLAI